MTARPHIWIHVRERIYMILLPFTLIYVFWPALWAAHTVLFACIRGSLAQYISLCLSLAQKMGATSHTYTKGPEDVSIKYLHAAKPSTSTATGEQSQE